MIVWHVEKAVGSELHHVTAILAFEFEFVSLEFKLIAFHMGNVRLIALLVLTLEYRIFF